MKTIGYCRVSRPQQNIERQVRNIRGAYPDAVIVCEKYTGTTSQRPEWQKVLRQVRAGKANRLIFDSVSRMSRNAEEGLKQYEELMNEGVELVFLKEPQINTEVYRRAREESIPATGTMIDPIIEGVNIFLQNLRREQIRAAFDQAEKEVLDNRQRTREGIETARLNGKQIGRPKGAQVVVKKKKQALKDIQKYSRDFNGTLSDAETMKLVGISRGTYYKYKRELLKLN